MESEEKIVLGLKLRWEREVVNHGSDFSDSRPILGRGITRYFVNDYLVSIWIYENGKLTIYE